MGRRRRGTVAAFDEFVGLGEIEADGERLAFHCTQLEDGTRSVEVGRAVEFVVTAGPFAAPEATAITKL